MNSGVLSRRDLDFLLFEWLRVDELAKRQRFAEHTTETFADVHPVRLDRTTVDISFDGFDA